MLAAGPWQDPTASKLAASVYKKKETSFNASLLVGLAEREVSSENATEWLVLAIFRIEVTTDLLSV